MFESEYVGVQTPLFSCEWLSGTETSCVLPELWDAECSRHRVTLMFHIENKVLIKPRSSTVWVDSTRLNDKTANKMFSGCKNFQFGFTLKKQLSHLPQVMSTAIY